MCEQLVLKMIRATGAKTEILRAESNCAAVFAGCIPTGSRAVFFCSEDSSQSIGQEILQMLSFCSPVCVRIERGCERQLFALEDDFHTVVALGSGAIAAARFFATVRSARCIAVPDSPSAKDCFRPCSSEEFERYPTAFPDFILLCDAWMKKNIAATLSETALSALCAEELRTDSLYTGREYRLAELECAAQGAVESCNGARTECVKLFFASALFWLKQSAFPPFACRGFVEFLNRRMPQNECKAAFSVLRFCTVRLLRLYRNARPRPYYVPDYVGRVSEAARQTGIALERLLKTVHIPRGEESFERLRIFSESRAKAAVSAELLADCVRRVSRGVFENESGMLPRFPLEEGYGISAELTPLICAPVLERDFGLLPPLPVKSHAVGEQSESAKEPLCPSAVSKTGRVGVAVKAERVGTAVSKAGRIGVAADFAQQ